MESMKCSAAVRVRQFPSNISSLAGLTYRVKARRGLLRVASGSRSRSLRDYSSAFALIDFPSYLIL